jgi:hypothetical protein
LVPAILVNALIIVVLFFVFNGVVVPWATINVITLGVAVHEVLGKDAEIEEQSNEAASEPAEVDKDVSSVNVTGLTGLAVFVLALGLVGEDGEDIGDVSKAGKEEEEHAKPVRRLAPPVEDELGKARSDVGDSAEISKDLAKKIEFQRILLFATSVVLVARGLLAEEPSKNAGCDDHHDDDGVPDDGLKDSGFLRSGIFSDMRNSWRQARPV